MRCSRWPPGCSRPAVATRRWSGSTWRRFGCAFAWPSHPTCDPDGEPALYGALFESIGPQINGWAFGDIDRLAAHMQEALDWDRSHANAFTPKSGHAADLEPIRNGLAAFRASVLTQKDELGRKRAAKGIENR